MCGRFVLEKSVPYIEKAFHIQKVLFSFEKRFNIAPGQTVAAIVREGENVLVGMAWGLIPPFAKPPMRRGGFINARGETVHLKQSFRNSFFRRRCIIPSTGYYEWKKRNGGKDPYLISLASKEPFAMAGIFEERYDPSENSSLTCAIITIEAAPLLAPIHDRMPVIIPDEEMDTWLSREIDSPDTLLPLLRPYPSEEMVFHRVSPYVNSPAHEGRQCIVPL